MGKFFSALVLGGIFGLGIAISGMANPAKIFNFFDVFGTWDPSLAFVMGGGLAVAFIGYRLIFRTRRTPILEPAFSLPTRRDIDGELIGGAAIFGVGWGIAGFCPGGAIPALGLGHSETFIFLGAMIAGIVIARLLRGIIGRPAIA
jgi:uncharacterized membrane protein YedE/YeeE